MPREASLPPTQPAEKEQPAVFSRAQVLRLLHLTERKLSGWERHQLISEQKEYRFSDLLMLKTIARLRDEKIPAQRIRRALVALREHLKDTPNLFSEVRVFSQGNRVRVQVGKHQMEPISGQLLFDFRESEISKLLHLPRPVRNTEKAAELLRRKLEADNWFEQGLDLEQRGAAIELVIEAYQKAAELDPYAAGALVNLGTIFFQGHAWEDAEAQYKKALAIDANYPLAHFNLGNLYDERGDFENALLHYKTALNLAPDYADVHYNLALLYQNAGKVMNAMRHWKAYLKLDSTSNWSDIARRELGKIESAAAVPGTRLFKVAPRAGVKE